jgi:imidazole glycerol-phosphate synthase subunit HisH
MRAVIIDYGMGNVASVEKALRFLKIESVLSNDPEIIRAAAVIVLPGVGAFAQGMQNLREANLIPVLHEEVMLKKKPFLGFCLGMQLLATEGTETQACAGLGWINGTVKKMNPPGLPVPHLGWNNITLSRPSEIITEDNADYYFIHSYHFDVDDKNNVLATVDYGQPYVAVIEHENIFATQFHPEKSQTAGLNILTRFFEKYA